MITKKAYYLACSFCRWTTRDIGLPDQNVASGGWPDPENPGLARFSTLQEYYRFQYILTIAFHEPNPTTFEFTATTPAL
jgi:hypothetical protein